MAAPMKIDSHQHFWKYSAQEYPWMNDPMERLRRDFLPADLEHELKRAGVDGSIAVQARQTVEESRWLLNLAGHHPLIQGVVGWVDLQSEQVEEDLAELSKHRKFVGVRHVVQDEPEDDFMLRPNFLRGLGKLKPFHLTYDLLLFPRHLRVASQVARQFPEQPFVLDHLAKPFIKTMALAPWREEIRELARLGNVSCKVSGMITEASWGRWKREDFQPYLDVVFETFGEDRLMFGSDWPVCLLSGRYEQVLEIVTDYLERWPERVRRKVLGENAVRIYGLGSRQVDP